MHSTSGLVLSKTLLSLYMKKKNVLYRKEKFKSIEANVEFLLLFPVVLR